jgi:ribulose-5-phosphate 4-epimerase/fuculose-1-phosphate aldolase
MAHEDERAMIDKLVLANRILAHYGIVDGFGHVSVRAEKPDTFLLSCS